MLSNLQPDRRREPRQSLNRTAHLRLGRRRDELAFVRDVSQGGAYFFTGARLEPGATFILVLPQAEAPAISRRGRVLRVERNGSGELNGVAARLEPPETTITSGFHRARSLAGRAVKRLRPRSAPAEAAAFFVLNPAPEPPASYINSLIELVSERTDGLAA